MKKWLFFVFAGLLCACDDNDDNEYGYSELSITQTTEGYSSFSKRTYKYKDGELLSHTIDQPSVEKAPQVSFDISTSAASYKYQCIWNGAKYTNYYNVTYSVNASRLATGANYVYQEGESRTYAMKYKKINEKYYLSSITEFIQDKAYYVLTFDYSQFNFGKIGLTQKLLDKERLRATLSVTHDNKMGIPDVHLNDEDFHPLDKHFEAIYGGLFGTFDYFISEISKETKTLASTTTETITSSIEFNTNGYPDKITSVSDHKSRKTKYFKFEYK